MTISRPQQIALAVCMMVALFVGESAAACACSHHKPVEEPAKGDCHSHRAKSAPAGESVAIAQPIRHATSIETDCTCVVPSATPIAAVQQSTKKSKSKDSVAGNLTDSPRVTSILIATSGTPALDNNDRISYSNALTCLLPPRAPPRP